MEKDKPRVITDYKNISPDLKEKIQLAYSAGYGSFLVNFRNSKGQKVLALRFETDDKIYLLRMSEDMAMKLVENDPDEDEYIQSFGVDLDSDEIGNEIDNLLDNNLFSEPDNYIS